jgi:hypothetical protein
LQGEAGCFLCNFFVEPFWLVCGIPGFECCSLPLRLASAQNHLFMGREICEIPACQIKHLRTVGRWGFWAASAVGFDACLLVFMKQTVRPQLKGKVASHHQLVNPR